MWRWRRWRWWQGAGGGPARLSWTSPKPVTPRHLETITGNNEGSGEPGCSGLEPCLCGTAKEAKACRHPLPPPPPPLFALALHTQVPRASCQEKPAPALQWGLLARLDAQEPGQESGGPSRLSFLLSLQDSKLIIVPPWALVSPKGSSGTTRLAGCSPRARMDLTSLVPGPMLPLSSVEQGSDRGTVTVCTCPACHPVLPSCPQHP